MNSSDKFNLTFNGEIRPGLNLTKVKVAFAQALTIEDAKRVDAFFSGEVVTLRRNLDKETAEAFYTKIYRAGAILKLVPAESNEAQIDRNSGMDSEFHTQSPGQVDQSWPIPSQQAPVRSKPAAKKKPILKKKSELSPAAASKAKAKPKTKIKVKKRAPSKATVAKAAKAAEEAAIQAAIKEAADNLEREAKQEARAAEEGAQLEIEKAIALNKAEQEAADKKAAEEAAKLETKKKAARDKAKKKAAAKKAMQAEAARLNAEEEAAKVKAAEETARLRAEEEAAKIKATEEAVRLKAEEEAAKIKATEEAARQRAEQEADEARKAEAIALKQALAAAEREKARRETARKKAIEEAALAKAAEQAALERARKEQAKKKALEKEAARIREEYAENKRIAAAKVVRDRVEESRRRAEKKVRLTEQKLNDAIASVAILERETERAKADLKKLVGAESAVSQSLVDKPQSASLRSSSSKQSASALDSLPPSTQKRQRGAPNFFSLRPFHTTPLLTQRAEQSGQLSKFMYLISAATAVAFVLLLVRTALQPAAQPHSQMTKSIIVDENSQLTLAAASHLFALDRAGVETQRYALSDFGLSNDVHLLSGNGSNGFIVQALQKESDSASADTDRWITLNCDLPTSQCAPYPDELGDGRISSWVVDARTQNRFVAVPSTDTLLKLSGNGEVIARASLKVPAQANLQLSAGLLYMSSAEGAAISIFRPDNNDFGQQLDEIIVQPPAALDAGQTLVESFVWVADTWWVLLRNPGTNQTGLYRFDEQWNFLGQIPLDAAYAPQSIIAWSGKVLLLYPQKVALQRFSADGQTEAPIVLEGLQSIVDKQQSTAQWTEKLWWALMVFLALSALFSFVLAQLYRLTRLIDNTTKFSEAQPIDTIDGAISWIDPAKNRNRAFRVLSLLYAIACGLVLTAVFALQLSPAIMLSAAIALTGPAVFIGYLWSSPTGHVGLVADGLILVDHHNTYHVGVGSRIHYRNNFLLIDDVLVFKGSRVFPVLDGDQMQQHILPRAIAGVKVDRKTLWIKVFQSRHPMSKGLFACFLSFTAAILCVILL